jgi:DNA invertase Pin-like site-specific DNA recombinase
VAERHAYGAVIVPKLSRFGRSMKELIRLFDVFDSDHIPLVFLDMNLDTSTSQGRLLRHILAATRAARVVIPRRAT